MSIITTEREQQRFQHLVLGWPRPRTRQIASKKLKRATAPKAPLSPGSVEERLEMRERWSHKAQGTPETHEHASRPARPGSLARLWKTGAIDDAQLAAAEEIGAGYWTIAADVAVRTANLEGRVDRSGHDRAEELQLGQLMADMTYTAWRGSLCGYGEALLAVIVHDQALTVVARRHGLSMPRARRLLTDALDLWWTAKGQTRRAARAIIAG